MRQLWVDKCNWDTKLNEEQTKEWLQVAKNLETISQHCMPRYIGIDKTDCEAIKYTVPLNYNFTFTRVSTRGATRGSRGKCQKLPWKASFPRNGPWLFHSKTHGISRHMAFPRDDTWHFHEMSRGISTRPVAVEFPREQ